MVSNSSKFPEAVRLPMNFDARRLQESLEILQNDYWVEHFIKNNYQGDWSVMPLTALEGRNHPILMASSVPGEGDFVPTPFLEKVSYIQKVIESFEANYLSIRMMRLGPDSEIKEHQDPDLDEKEVRLHIPIQTNPQVSFYLNQKIVKMNVGECWYLRLSDPHRVVNASDQARVHLVMDFELNDWLEDLILPK